MMTNQSMPLNGTNMSLPLNGTEIDWGALLNVGVNTASGIIQQNNAAKAAQIQAEAQAKIAQAQADAAAKAAQAQADIAASQAASYAAQQELLNRQMAAEQQSYQLQMMSQPRAASGDGTGVIDRIKNWWAGASTGEKVFAGVATVALVYGGYKGVRYITSNKKRRKK